jgi:hypothetical protein
MVRPEGLEPPTLGSEDPPNTPEIGSDQE